MSIKENAKQGIYSTVFGGLIILASVVSVFIPSLGIDWTGAAVGIGIGGAMIGLIKK